jgi:hypothetical protein
MAGVGWYLEDMAGYLCFQFAPVSSACAPVSWPMRHPP